MRQKNDADYSYPPFAAPIAPEADVAARQSVIEALPLLPAELTADYREAREAAPDLIMGETNPTIFLRCEKGDPWSAAKRLALHWTLRREVFGEDRWLRKVVDLSGDGAMNADDMALLHAGVFALTWPSSSSTPNEETKQQALLVNFSRLNGRDPGPSRHRVFMFLMYFLNVYTQENGLIVLMSLPGSGVRVRSDNGKMLKESYRSQLFWVKQIFLIHDPNDGRQMLVRTFAAMIASLVRRVLDRVPQMIVAPDRACTRSLLQMHSVDPHLVPEHLGGFWSYRQFDLWLDQLFRQEERSTDAPCDTTADTYPTHPESGPVIGTSLIFQAGRDLQDTRRRQLPAHIVKLRKGESAKNRYNKRKKEVEDLQNHERELREQNRKLQGERARLERLLELSLCLIQQHAD
eukprot:scaffold4740_cov165-Amphora_coffeaeformis.AAC.8